MCKGSQVRPPIWTDPLKPRELSNYGSDLARISQSLLHTTAVTQRAATDYTRIALSRILGERVPCGVTSPRKIIIIKSSPKFHVTLFDSISKNPSPYPLPTLGDRSFFVWFFESRYHAPIQLIYTHNRSKLNYRIFLWLVRWTDRSIRWRFIFSGPIRSADKLRKFPQMEKRRSLDSARNWYILWFLFSIFSELMNFF